MEHRRPSELAENSSFSLTNAGFPAATAAPPLLLGSPWTSQKLTWMFQGSALRQTQGQTTPEGGDKRGGSAATPQHCSPPNPGVARGANPTPWLTSSGCCTLPCRSPVACFPRAHFRGDKTSLLALSLPVTAAA